MCISLTYNKMKELVDFSIDQMLKDCNSRLRSFDHAHEAFRKGLYSSCVTDDELAKDLFVFLASWGMLRGSTGLLQKDYKFLIPIIRILRNVKYKPIMDIDPLSLGSSGVITLKEYVDLIMELKREIQVYFKSHIFYYLDKKTKKFSPKKVGATDTLISKILLAVFGCVPAYDNYVKKALKKLGIRNTFDEKGLTELIICLNKHKNEIKQAVQYVNAKLGVNYPVMRVVDMILWAYGILYC